ncbi:MAG: hypothetical protein P1U67_09180 [Alcanivoracaceae bacterium]|nr:hypothetical protein [Alcanivoracaceae bacterium]
MVIGHYATALIPYQKHPTAPLSLFLFAAIFLDAVWLALALIGIETPHPAGLLDASLLNLHVDMPWSHDLLPVLGWAMLMSVIGWGVTRSKAVALWCGALVVVHEISDLLAGFNHYVAGTDSQLIGLGLYSRAPELALLFEGLLGVVCTAWFIRARRSEGCPVSKQGGYLLYAIFIGGAAMQLIFARSSLGVLFGIT